MRAPALLAAAAASCGVLAIAVSVTSRPPLPPSIITHRALPSRRPITVAAPIAVAAVLACLVAPMPAPLLAPLVGIAAWKVPVFIRGRVDRRRRARADAELPQLLDLLAAASSAGLSASLAVRRAAGALRGPLADELRGVMQAVDLGGRWRDELRSTADRLALPDLRRTVAALTRTETLGSSLATSMQELADRVRASRRAAVTERARTAPVKMLFPLVFLVLPAFLLLTVVPVLLTTLQSIR
jgi:pilus assembly protein TadC